MTKQSPAPSPWWNKNRHNDRRPFLLARTRIKSAIRSWFEAQGFIEVDPACLQVSPGNEAHLHAFKTERVGTDLVRQDLYLHTSPEFAMKKLLAAGEEKIFSFAPVFRNRESGALHAPEFTMLEWYRTGAPYERLMEDCTEILKIAAAATGARLMSFRGMTCNPMTAAERLPVAEAFSRYAGVDLLSSSLPNKGEVSSHPPLSWSDIFSRTLAAEIEPKLGVGHPTLLTEYPTIEAALARPKPDDPRVAERFEMYVCGVELANGFGELNDPAEQRRRFEDEMAEKEACYGERYPIDEDFLAALAHMPPASGCALGFDRLVMLATGAERIEQVLWTPRPEMP